MDEPVLPIEIESPVITSHSGSEAIIELNSNVQNKEVVRTRSGRTIKAPQRYGRDYGAETWSRRK